MKIFFVFSLHLLAKDAAKPFADTGHQFGILKHLSATVKV